MRENLEKAVELIMRHEGGYVDHPSDPGNCTNYGITISTYRKRVDARGTCADLKKMSAEVARGIYRDTYWSAVGGDDLPSGVDVMVFDFGVNAGPARAVRLLQRLAGVAQDGIVGPQTIAAVQDMDSELLIDDYTQARQNYYRSLRHWKVFGRGWTRRNRETQDVALELIA